DTVSPFLVHIDEFIAVEQHAAYTEQRVIFRRQRGRKGPNLFQLPGVLRTAQRNEERPLYLFADTGPAFLSHALGEILCFRVDELAVVHREWLQRGDGLPPAIARRVGYSGIQRLEHWQIQRPALKDVYTAFPPVRSGGSFPGVDHLDSL